MIVKICLSAWQVLEIDSLDVSIGLLQKIGVVIMVCCIFGGEGKQV